MALLGKEMVYTEVRAFLLPTYQQPACGLLVGG
jgi:hypothetical protein